MVTLLVEIESILNGRPLTPVSFVEDLQRPLTPRDLLLLCPGTGLPPAGTDNADAIYANRWRQTQLFADRFWNRWAKEYLPTVACRSKWLSPKRNVCVNDIVIVLDENTPRSSWPLGRVTKTFPDIKGFVRSASVKIQDNEFKRPVSKMCKVVPADGKENVPLWLSSL